MANSSGPRAKYDALTDTQKAFIENPHAEASRSVDDWISVLAPIAAFDSEHDAAKAFWFREKRIGPDVPNRLRLVVVPLLYVLREEAGGNATLGLRLDLNGFEQPAKLVGRTHLDRHNSRYVKADQFSYWDPWLTAALTLPDRTGIICHAIDRGMVRTGTKRGASGKSKTFHKAKLKRRIEVTLKLSARVWTWSDADPRPYGRALTRRSSDRRLIVRLRSNGAAQQMPEAIFRHPERKVIEDGVTIEDFMSVISRAYHFVTPVASGGGAG